MPRPPSQPLLRAPRPTHPLAPPVDEAPPARVPDPQSGAGALPRRREPQDDQVLSEVREPASMTLGAGEELRTFTTRLPVDLRRRLRRHAIDTDQTLEQVARAMVTEYLDRHEHDGV